MKWLIASIAFWVTGIVVMFRVDWRLGMASLCFLTAGYCGVRFEDSTRG